jgi:tetratricopeptide (TPR) repeat protein
MNWGQKSRRLHLCSLILAFTFGCATSPPQEIKIFSSPDTVAQETKDAFAEFAAQSRLKARERERKGDWAEAVRSWEVVAALLPSDPEAKGKMAFLKKELSETAERHFREGVTHFQDSSFLEARKEFLSALYFNPDHMEALDYLKTKLPGEDILLHPVKRGETLKSIAQETYQDPQKDFLIAYFNGVEPDAKIGPPAILRLPRYDPRPAMKETDAPKSLPPTTQDGGGRSEKTRSPSVASPPFPRNASPAKGPAPDSMPRESLNASHYESGIQLNRDRRFQEALDAFSRVDPGYKDVKLQISRTQKHLAESHYINGVKYFTEEEIERAIEEWEIALVLDPKHPKANKDIEDARLLLQKLEKIP